MSDSEQPTQVTSGQTAETSADNLTPVGAPDYSVDDVDDPTFQVVKLATWLEENFPQERSRSNRQVPESPVDTAIRLLQALSASAPLSVLPRCGEPYCNRPESHEGEHGWVHNG